MNDDHLQNLIEQLEQTGSLSNAQKGAANPDERALLDLVAALRDHIPPAPPAEAVSAQRAALVKRVDAIQPDTKKWPGWFQLNIRNLWLGAAAAAFLLLIGVILFLPGREPAGNPLVEIPETVVQDSANDRPQEYSSGGVGIEDGAGEAAAEDDTARVIAEKPDYAVFLPLSATSIEVSPEKAIVFQINGRVERFGESGRWERISRSAVLVSGDRLRTGPLSGATVRFFDGSEASLDARTEIIFEIIAAHRPDDGFRTVVMHQVNGVSRHRVDHRGDAGSRYEVTTPTASGIARGTRFTVGVDLDQSVSYAVLEGRVDVSGAGQTVAVAAGQQTAVPVDGPPASPVFSISGQGKVTSIGETEWVIAGQIFAITADTMIVGTPQVGDTVEVEGYLGSGGERIAAKIQTVDSLTTSLNQFSLVGEVEEIGAAVWMVQGQAVLITDTTQIEDEIGVGETVHITGGITPEGELVAQKIVLVETEAGFPFEFAGLVDAIDPWVVSGVSLETDENSTIEAGIEVGDAVAVRGIINVDGDWIISSIILLEFNAGTFSITGELTGISPWAVNNIPFEVDDSSRVSPGLMVGDLVFARGRILSDGTWVADVVERLDAANLEIIFAGTVDQIDPWVVSGLPLTTDENSRIEEGIAVGDLVRVSARILPDGTWLIAEMTLLSQEILGINCVTLTAVVTALPAGSVVLSDGTTVYLGEIEIEGDLQIGSVVVILACVDEDGTITIERIIVLYNPPKIVPTPISPPPGGGEEAGGRVTICHKPGTPAEQTKTLPSSALGGHLGHGDTLGPCP